MLGVKEDIQRLILRIRNISVKGYTVSYHEVHKKSCEHVLVILINNVEQSFPTWSRNFAMTISGGVERRCWCSSRPKSDMVDSTEVSNWEEELAIASIKTGDDDLEYIFF